MTGSGGDTFIIDANILIEPHKTYYSFDFVPEFWSFIEKSIAAKRSWSVPSVADPFLIAVAIHNNYTVITGERPNAGLNRTNPSPKVKIPDICAQFNVKWGNLFNMLTQLGFRRTS